MSGLKRRLVSLVTALATLLTLALAGGASLKSW